MKQAVLLRPQSVAVQQVDGCTPNKEDCLVRVEVAAVCSLDVRAFLGKHTRLRLDIPPVLGHEVFGNVVQSGINGPPVGTSVAIIGSWFCKTCRYCLEGFPLKCSNFTVAAGGFSEELVIPAEWCEWRLVALGPEAEPVAAAYLDSVACVLRAVRLAQLTNDDRLVICGGGFLACLLSVLARNLTDCGVVVITDSQITQQTLDYIQQPYYGWNDALDSTSKHLAADVMIDLAGRPELGEYCNKHLQYGARCIIMNGNSSAMLPSFAWLYNNRINIFHSFHNDLNDRKAAVDVLPTLTRLIKTVSLELPLEECQNALSLVSERRVMRCHLVTY